MKYSVKVITVTYIVCMLVLISDYKVISNIVGSITTLITLLLLSLDRVNKKTPNLEKKSTVCIIFFLFYFTITSFLSFNPQEWGTTLLIYLMAFTPFFYNTNLSIKNDSAQMRTLVVAFFIIWNVFLYLCLTTCLEIPNLARMMTSDRRTYYSIINGGGYYMGYGCSILITYLYSKLIWGEFHRSITRFAVILEIVFMVATVLVINSYVILVSMVAGFIVATIDRIAKTAQSRVFSYFIAFVLLLLLYFNFTNTLKYLSGSVTNEFWNTRIVETYESAVYSEDSYHVGERERVYQISIDGFLKSPLFGNGYKNGNVYEGEGLNNIGNHSTIWDSLSQFGIIGSISLFLFLLYPWRSRRRDGGNWVHLVPFLIMAFLNPVLKCYHVMVILFLIIPCMEVITKEAKLRTPSNNSSIDG